MGSHEHSPEFAVSAKARDSRATMLRGLLERIDSDLAAGQWIDKLILISTLCVSILGLWWMLGPQAARLWDLWTRNGLASIGMLIPIVAVILAVRAWRARRWERRGSWWGFLICAAALLLSSFAKTEKMPLFTYHEVTLQLFPTGLLVFLYVSGVVILFAGFQYYRAALFPIGLLLFLNPAPGFFTTMIDLPLQYVGAHTARAFAQWVGVPLTVDRLRIMFSPSLGMFIAPGCNGLRGALAMGFLAAILGHLYAVPSVLRSVYVASGVAIAYIFNLVRLCGLVLCYRVALAFTPLAVHMETVDYVLGGMLFFLSALFVLGLPRRWKRFSKQPASS